MYIYSQLRTHNNRLRNALLKYFICLCVIIKRMKRDAICVDMLVCNKLSIHKKRRRKMCDFSGCGKPPTPIVGICSYCMKYFCLMHRLPEIHFCTELDKCKNKSFSRNEATLMASKCVPNKLESV